MRRVIVDQKIIYSRSETAQMLGLSVRLIDRAIADGTLSVKRVGGRILIPHSSVERFIQSADPRPKAAKPPDNSSREAR
jgi:excisionase family DNA binding protein